MMEKLSVINEGNVIYLKDKNLLLNHIEVSPPSNFSIIDNTEEVISFFNEVNTIFSAKNFSGSFLFDLKNVCHVTADAVMYMNALAINRLTHCENQKVLLKWPEKKKSKRILLNCGLKDYLSGGKNKTIRTKNNYTITGGRKTDVEHIRKIALFTKDKLHIEISDLDFITSTLVELMNNTEQHAYDYSDDKLWYIFVEDTKSSLKFTFLDTGKGIPETMRKSFGENIDDLLPILNDDHSYFIFEALKGEFLRSSTDVYYRNTGLPEIYKHYRERKLSKLKIISCKGVCNFYDSDRTHPNLYNLTNSFNGTLFTWEIKKDRSSYYGKNKHS